MFLKICSLLDRLKKAKQSKWQNFGRTMFWDRAVKNIFFRETADWLIFFWGSMFFKTAVLQGHFSHIHKVFDQFFQAVKKQQCCFGSSFQKFYIDTNSTTDFSKSWQCRLIRALKQSTQLEVFFGITFWKSWEKPPLYALLLIQPTKVRNYGLVFGKCLSSNFIQNWICPLKFSRKKSSWWFCTQMS